MYSDFQELLKKRHYETIGFLHGVKIIQRRKTEYNCLVEDALDQFYIERLLEIGDCIMCQTKTSKFCSNCGSHYCSSDCQEKDWPNHALTCMRSSSPSPSSLDLDVEDNPELVKSKYFVDFSKESSDMERKKRSGNILMENTTVNKTTDYKILKNDYTLNDNVDTNKQSNFGQMRNIYKKGVEKNHIKVNNMRVHQRRFIKLGEALRVKCIKNQGSICWGIQDSDLNELENMEKILSEEANTYPLVEDVKLDLYAMMYNQKWHRCKLFLNQNGKKLARCVDYGIIFSPKYLHCRELPDHIREIKELALKLEFINSTAPEEDSFVDVTVISFGVKGVYQVEICKDKKNEVSKDKKNEVSKDKKNQVSKDKKNQVSKDKKNEIRVKKKIRKAENVLLQRSVLGGLKPSSEGLFFVGKADGEELVGCIVPDDNHEALFCWNTMKNIFPSTDLIKTTAVISDHVMVICSDGVARRGIVKNTNKDTCIVHLIDYGYTVETKEVYKLPEEVVHLIKLECGVTVSKILTEAHYQFEHNVSYRFKVMEKLEEGQLMCEFSYLGLRGVIAYGMLHSVPQDEPINYVRFKNNCKVSISYVGNRNEIFVVQNKEIWRKRINEVNFEINNKMNLSDVNLGSLRVGNLVLGRFRSDGKWYRAKVTKLMAEEREILFIDYGNSQISGASELRVLPKSAKFLPIFLKKVILFGPDDSFSSKGRDYLEKIVKEGREFIMTYRDSESSEEVTLRGDDGTDLNALAYWKPEEENILGSVTEKYLDNECIPESTSNLVVLSVNQKEFSKYGVFWAVYEENENFKNMTNNVSYLMNKYFESNHEEFLPKKGELCIVNFEGGWYRAQVTFVFGPLVEVFFVDFGRTEIVSKQMIRKMMPVFLKVPAVASKCVLNDFHKYSATEIEHFYSVLISNINISLKEKAVVKKVVENTHYVELSDMDYI